MSKKVRPKYNPDWKATAPKVAYLCDGKACETCSDRCKHTLDENHAKNKIRRNRKFKCENGGYYEVEK